MAAYRRLALVPLGLSIWLPIAATSANQDEPPNQPGKQGGTTHVPGFTLPPSSLLSEKTRSKLADPDNLFAAETSAREACPRTELVDPTKIPEVRNCQAQAFYKTSFYQQLRNQYSVQVTPQEIGGVYTEVITPSKGVAPRNANRALINLHSGSFTHGARWVGRVEAMPVASAGEIRVFSIDYRMAPDSRFPAASEDVATVYRALLKTYPARNIGIYGSSAGGLLTAESMAWFEVHKLPLPGAVGMFSEGAGYWEEGDSGQLNAGLRGHLAGTADRNPYFAGTDLNDPLAFPIRSVDVLARFPPSLLISATRDMALSSVVQTHTLLVSQGVLAELHVWEGLGHGFFLVNPELVESQQAVSVIVKFFDEYLGSGIPSSN